MGRLRTRCKSNRPAFGLGELSDVSCNVHIVGDIVVHNVGDIVVHIVGDIVVHNVGDIVELNGENYTVQAHLTGAAGKQIFDALEDSGVANARGFSYARGGVSCTQNNAQRGDERFECIAQLIKRSVD